MKKKILLLLCFAAFTVQAQDYQITSTIEKPYKPTAGDITTEVGFNFNNGISLNRGQIRLRKFGSETIAYRLGVHVDYFYNKFGDMDYQTTFGVNVAPGIEKHFKGTNKLSPFIGAELPVGYRSSKSKNEHLITEGGWGLGDHTGSRANFNVGLNGLAGMDYYLVPRFYIGFEVGAGIQYRKDKDIVRTNEQDISFRQESKGYHRIDFSPFSTGGIRLGFAF